jgi:membrane-bound lytic murein transglycosylase B
MAGNGAVFFSSGVQFDVDPRLIVAISGQESHFGRDLGQPRAACSARSSFLAGAACAVTRISRHLQMEYNGLRAEFGVSIWTRELTRSQKY